MQKAERSERKVPWWYWTLGVGMLLLGSVPSSIGLPMAAVGAVLTMLAPVYASKRWTVFWSVVVVALVGCLLWANAFIDWL